MAEFMTPKGFEIAYNIRAKMLWLRAWGAWDQNFGKKYQFALREKMLELSRQAHWKIWYILVDFTHLSTSPEELEALTAEQLASADTLGVKKIAYIRNGHDTQSVFLRERDGLELVAFESMNEALQWLTRNA